MSQQENRLLGELKDALEHDNGLRISEVETSLDREFITTKIIAYPTISTESQSLLLGPIKVVLDSSPYKAHVFLQGREISNIHEFEINMSATRQTRLLMTIIGTKFEFGSFIPKRAVKHKPVKQSRTGARLPSNAEMLKVIGR